MALETGGRVPEWMLFVMGFALLVTITLLSVIAFLLINKPYCHCSLDSDSTTDSTFNAVATSTTTGFWTGFESHGPEPNHASALDFTTLSIQTIQPTSNGWFAGFNGHESPALKTSSSVGSGIPTLVTSTLRPTTTNTWWTGFESDAPSHVKAGLGP